MTDRYPLFIITNNHFDPTWRRCWDRRFTFRGEQFVSYAEIEEAYLTENMALAAAHPEYAFEAESALVVRKFVERHPERLAELRRLAAAHRFAVPGAGENIVDGNMILGESLVRNFLLGLLWVEEHLGQKTTLGIRSDAFGNCAQIPQIFRGCEIEWVNWLSYSEPASGNYWRGLDGSTVCFRTVPMVNLGGGGADKYPPCPTCHGSGCGDCDGRGFQATQRTRLPQGLDEATIRDFGAGKVYLGPEELLPNPEIIAWARAQAEQYDIRFAVQQDLYPLVRSWVKQVDDPPAGEICPTVELNPNNAGCWVTRIKTKQTCRRQEYALLGAEALCALALPGAYPREALAAAWRELLFTMFHDAITATHVDASYTELQDFWARIDDATAQLRNAALQAVTTADDGIISVVNPFGVATADVVTVTLPAGASLANEAGQPVPALAAESREDGTVVSFLADAVPPFSARRYRVLAGAAPKAAVQSLPAPVIENERFRVSADEHGITAIHDKRLGRDIAVAGAYRPNELVLERDEGSPWATLSPHRPRFGLAEHTRLLGAEAGPGWQRLTFECKRSRPTPDIQLWMSFHLTVTLYDGLERVEFATAGHWDAYQCRLRVAMPVAQAGAGVYGIPYGMLERGAYEPFYSWYGANGDWPAVGWAGVQGADVSVALLDRGTPSYCVETGEGGQVLWLSLLRSPATPTYLHEPYYYVMTDFDGMRDAGDHAFRYALCAYDVPFAESSVVTDAESFNAGLLVAPGAVALPAGPVLDSACARLSAFKRAEQDDALVARIVEYRGTGGPATLSLPAGIIDAAKVNLLERQAEPLEIVDGKVTVHMRPWEIATVRME